MYGFSTRLRTPYDTVVKKVIDALKTEGFGVLTEIDVQATLKTKLGIEKRPYIILGACNPQLAHQALEADVNVGLLLPCNVIVREESDSSVIVSFLDPLVISNLVDSPKIVDVAQEARKRLERVRESLHGENI